MINESSLGVRRAVKARLERESGPLLLIPSWTGWYTVARITSGRAAFRCIRRLPRRSLGLIVGEQGPIHPRTEWATQDHRASAHAYLLHGRLWRWMDEVGHGPQGMLWSCMQHSKCCHQVWVRGGGRWGLTPQDLFRWEATGDTSSLQKSLDSQSFVNRWGLTLHKCPRLECGLWPGKPLRK